MVLEPWQNFKVFCAKTDTLVWYRQLIYERDLSFFESTHFFVRKIMENPFVVNKDASGRKSEKRFETRLYKHGEVMAKYFK